MKASKRTPENRRQALKGIATSLTHNLIILKINLEFMQDQKVFIFP
jgi:hypothetical protein